MNKWVNSAHTLYYIKKNTIDRIDSGFTLQCPPYDFTRAPRSIQKHLKVRKASEYSAWLLFYSLPSTIVSMDLLSAFVIKIERDQTLPTIAVRLESVMSRCMLVQPNSSYLSLL